MSNQLVKEISPYLQMHKDQPVHWYPWGDDAFSKAKKENKPVFLSIGYSTCHWCHVMAEECFEDSEVASVLNRCFVSVKVDREEYPDVDAVYMNVCQSLTGSGGWPLSLFLTPDQKPFFAGTYFPKQSRGGRIGFLDLLRLIADKWEHRREELQNQAEYITDELAKASPGSFEIREESFWIQKGIDDLKKRFDSQNGGFGSAPKFPVPQNLLFLADCYETSHENDLLQMMKTTLSQMAKGGIFDQIGGGFCRYSTDARFLVPHFEKMLYDNGLLMFAYVKGYELTKDPVYINVAEKTAAFLCRSMKSSSGGFYAAQDADSDGEEGKYYLFTPDEILSFLGEEKGQHFNQRYDITEEGNFEGKNIPNLLHSEMKPDDFLLSNENMEKLCREREKRFILFTDKKILTSWNSMAILAFAALYRMTGKGIYLSVAEEIQQDIVKFASSGYCLFRGHYGDRPMEKGTSEDYAWFIRALISLYEATLKEKYLESAKEYCEEALRSFFDYDSGGFSMRDRNQAALILEIKESYDHAYPCANALMTENLRLLYFLTDDLSYDENGKKQRNFMEKQLASFPYGSFYFLMVLNQMENPPKRIVCAGKEYDDWEKLPLKFGLRDLVLKKISDPAYPLMNERMTFYVCDETSCRPPQNEITGIFK
ncbi:MAG: thioredoxin domain-containing protein [Clostridia bacterium]